MYLCTQIPLLFLEDFFLYRDKFFFFSLLLLLFSGLGPFDVSRRIYHLLFDIKRSVHRDIFLQ